jgi:hypothetical protein
VLAYFLFSLVSVLTRREKLLVWLHETVAFWSLSRVASAHAFTLTCTHAEKLVSSFIPIRLSLSLSLVLFVHVRGDNYVMFCTARA